jgi:amino acid adenylation domain-containing protein/non-ribosomal peptide synthase protein (TIGR01720 family)
MIISLLGILKVGAAYLPIDFNYPAERVALMLADAQPAYMLRTSAVAVNLPDNSRLMVLDHSETVGALMQSSTRNPGDKDRRRPIRRANLAYVIYTSGSTGRPKGTAIEHRSATELLCWASELFEKEDLAGILASTSICFDLSVFELFVPLSQGGTIILAENVLQLPNLAHAEKVRLINTVPSAMTELLRMEGLPESVRTVNLAGEALSRSLVAEIYERANIQQVFNLYGPTEDTTYSTYSLLARSDIGEVSIGRPISNTRIYVLDRSLAVVPVGVTGEIYIAGAGLARGYLGQAALTAERFVADPYGQPGTRMYRTGDLARWREDGNLEFLGRTDQQVKIRGFRIEPGEIEAALREHADGAEVAQAAVVVREDRPGEKALVGYVVAAPGYTLDGNALRRRLGQSLPDYMAPAAIVVLEHLPLTPNGKLDRKALPKPEYSPVLWRAPRTPEEEILCGLFAEALGVERVGPDDNLFALGGHSLIATRLASRIRVTLGIEIPIRMLFESPSVGKLAARLREGSNRRARLVRQRRPDRLPLSYGQRRLWFLDQLQGASTEYSMQQALRLRGKLDVEALEMAINTIVERHESLRTHFVEVEGEPEQMIEQELRIEAPVEDLSRLEEAEQRARVMAALRREGEEPFDLERGPMLRVKLLKLGEGDHILLRTMHHIASDGWSEGIFNREFVILYEAFLEGRVNPLMPLRVQYADFALWQRELLGGERLEEGLAYWKRRLEGIPEHLELPTDRVRPAVQSFEAEACQVILDRGQVERLKRLSQANQSTLYMTLLSAFGVLLGRYSGQEEIVVGSPIANRQEAELEEMIGFFVNTLVMRMRVKGNLSYRELLEDVRRAALEAYERQDVPFERLVEELSPQRSLNRTPVFQVVFALQNAPWTPQRLKGLEVEIVRREGLKVRYDLEAHVHERESEIAFYWLYNRDLFERWRIEQMARHYLRVLEAMVADADQVIGRVDLLDEVERRQILEEWNETTHAVPDATLTTLFEEQIERTLESVAVVFGEEALSYRKLNERANRLAHLLIGIGVGPEDLVGLAVPRSLEMVVGLLGILKAGAAYLPLDLDNPQERLAFILKDARPCCILTISETAQQFPENTLRLILDEPGTVRALAGCSAINPGDGERSTTLNPHNPAYVIYTSGSTGTPKGVIITHQNVVRLFGATGHWYQFRSDDVWTLFHSYAFDFSVWEIWGPLLHGGRLLIVPYLISRSPGEFLNFLVERGVTVLNQTPSAFYQLMQSDQERPDSGQALALRYVIFGGEKLALWRLRDWYRRHPEGAPSLINMYGITETTVHVSCIELDQQAGFESTNSLIGRGIPDLRVYILDLDLQPAPVGVIGELCVAGAGLARGYLNQPALTAERFVADSLGAPGSRIYRSGDLARWRPDGNLEFVGRGDHQVKIRGFRIELGEIEMALRTYQGVKEAVVVAREQADGEKRLVAYVVGEAGQAPSPSQWRHYLKAKLPEYMIPAVFVALERLPLTTNGKIDRQALPELEEARPDLEQAYEAPRTAAEEKLTEIWSQVLRLERVGVHDNFFALGGDSILCIQVVARAQQSGLRLTPRQMFEHQTVAELAAVAGSIRAVAAEQGEVSGEVELTPIQHWFFETEPEGQSHYNQSVVLETKQPVGLLEWERVIGGLVRHHDALRLRFKRIGEQWRQENAAREEERVVGKIDLQALPGELRGSGQKRAFEQLQSSLDLSRGPLVRVGIVGRGAGERERVAVVIHHLAVDGVSWRILLEDLERVLRGELSQAKTTSYQEWARQLKACIESGMLEEERSYWREAVQGTVRLPVEEEAEENLVRDQKMVMESLSEGETRRLLQEVPEAYGTQVQEVLLTALGEALGEWAAGAVLVDVEGHGREEEGMDVDLTRTVGWFTSLYPVRVERWRGSVGENLKQVKERVREIPRRGQGYGLLRYLSQTGEAMEALPSQLRADVSFNYLGQFDSVLEEGGILQATRETAGQPHAFKMRRRYLLEIVGSISGGRLRFVWTYNERVHKSETVEKVALRYIEALRELISHCLSPEAGGYSPSDFPLASLTSQELDQLLAELNQPAVSH